MIKWIDINDEEPEYYTVFLIAYKTKDDSDSYGIAIASLQYSSKNQKDYWHISTTLTGDDYFEEDYIVTHWFPYQDEFNYPDEYYE